MDGFSVAVFLKSKPPPDKQKTQPAVRWEVPVQHQATPSDFVFWVLLLLLSQFLKLFCWPWQSLAIFLRADQLETFSFLKRQEFSCHLSSVISWWKQARRKKPKTNLLAADNSAEEDQIGPTEAAKLQLTQASSLHHPHGQSAEVTSVGTRDRTSVIHDMPRSELNISKGWQVSSHSQVLGSPRLNDNMSSSYVT